MVALICSQARYEAMEIEKALHRFESAAEAAGYIIEIEKNWPKPARSLGSQHEEDNDGISWCTDSFNRELAVNEFKRCGFKLNREYFYVLERWNGVGLRLPEDQ